VRDYRLTLDTESTENLLYDTELVEMRDVKLPQYQEKIADAYAKATSSSRTISFPNCGAPSIASSIKSKT
jgi:hypothetical protein